MMDEQLARTVRQAELRHSSRRLPSRTILGVRGANCRVNSLMPIYVRRACVQLRNGRPGDVYSTTSVFDTP